MVLTPHFVFGAAIGTLVKNPLLAILLAFLGHYILDSIPHVDYPIENIKKKQWRNVFPEILMVMTDFFIGILIIFMFSDNQPIVYMCAFFSVLSDGLNLLGLYYPNKILNAHTKLHHEKIHFLTNQEFIKPKTKYGIKICFLGRIATQIIVVVISVFLMA